MATISEILEETKKYIAVKEASFKGGFKRAQAMEGIDSMPGAEHDSPVPTSYEKPDPEVDDGSQGPEGAFSNIEGAGKEDITMKHVLEVDESAETPDEEPLITDEADADPKTASVKLANNLLSRIKKFQATKRAANQQFNLKLDSKTLDKLAGQKQEPAQKQAAGQKPTTKDIARQLVSNVMAQKQAAAKEAERRGAEAALRDALNSAYAQGANDTIQKVAQMMGADPAMMSADPAATAGGQDAMAAMAGAPAPEVAPVPAAAPEAAPAEGDANLEVPEDLKGEDITAEDVVNALDSAVNNGEIDPETAQAVLSELAAAEGGEGSPEEPSAEDKEAAEKFASAIVEAHNEILESESVKQASANDEAVKFAQAIEEAANEIDDAEAAADEASGDEPTVEEVQQAVSELVDEGKIDPETGAAILETVGATEDGGEGDDKEASEKQAMDFAGAIKEAADEIDAAEAASAAEDGGDKGSGEEVDPAELIEGIAELVQSGEVSPEDAEAAIHAIIGEE